MSCTRFYVSERRLGPQTVAAEAESFSAHATTEVVPSRKTPTSTHEALFLGRSVRQVCCNHLPSLQTLVANDQQVRRCNCLLEAASSGKNGCSLARRASS